ncbi:Acetyltransferase (GNAT) family protein [Collimonas sp. OK307]|nr:Acetyltransferase (GNAT) family protein [Collimonas sp. OK307]
MAEFNAGASTSDQTFCGVSVTSEIQVRIRNFDPIERDSVDAVVRGAWTELIDLMPQGDQLAARLGSLTEHADQSEIIVAELNSQIVGAVGYVGAHQPKPGFFQADWPMVRMLSVAPGYRGLGLGKQLLEECVARAKRDDAPVLALHTTSVMKAAQRLYVECGFEKIKELPLLFGVPCALYTKTL